LRPFERHEADIFFGRERQVDQMVDRLARHRLLAVTGSSGCGKSSLVRAGLPMALETGLLAPVGPVWRFATLRPGDHPVTELAAALLEALGDSRLPDHVALREALERGPWALIEELSERPLPDGGNLLILVDQFEELFRFHGPAAREEAGAFVALLLASAGQDSVPIYVVLTMRSDFLGHCAEFDGLAEAVSNAQYLCPRLSRDQIRSAIEGPAEVFGGKVEPRLVARIVNDMGTDPDQLPLMQHALMRLWGLARARDPNAPMLCLDDYVAEGGLMGSLSHHADEILAKITRDAPQRAEITRRLFCLLTEGEGETVVRRLAEVKEVMAVTSEPLDEVAIVANAFRAPGRSLLMPGLDRPLTSDTVLDISHESLIRQWQALRDWVRTEASSAEQYREIERRTRRWNAGSAAFLAGVDLDVALAWRERERPTAAWAARYGGDFALAMRFLDESRARRDAAQRDAAQRDAAQRDAAQRDAAQRDAAQREYCVSYAWGDLTPEGKDSEEIIDRLCAAAEQRGIRILRDKTALGLGESISRFMQRIGRGDRIFVVLSDKYLKSPYCMFELFEVWRNSRADSTSFVERVRAYTLPGTKVSTSLDRLQHAIYWKEQYEALEAVVKSHGLGILGENDLRQFKLMQDFAHRVSDILATVADVLQPRNFDALEHHWLDSLGTSA
jgi:hypothetical protein